ncbi:MAG: DUF423 domain-containing protein [Balneolaceae bacterium]|nr:DUF423 domain-containing protein [Balneolaceae bacterium]
MSKLFITAAGIGMALAVTLGAFGAHGLRGRLTPEMMEIFQTGVQYHLIHALGLLAVGLLAIHFPESAYLKWSGWLMLAGIVLFSGSLYILSMSGIRWLGAVTPVGGLSFIAAWILMVFAAIKSL